MDILRFALEGFFQALLVFLFFGIVIFIANILSQFQLIKVNYTVNYINTKEGDNKENE